MDVLMLGTGSADGWPTPFCRCGSCLAARERQEIRTPTSVLLDHRLILDCGPEAPRQALRAGTDLADVRTVLVSHAHSDHLDPAFLLHRSWVLDTPLTVYGPPAVIEECRPWLAPDQTSVTLREVAAGEEFEVDGYQVLAIAANHEAFGPALLFRVSDGERSLVYACDTGPWDPSALAMLTGRRVDLVILEETFGDRTDLNDGGHQDLSTFPQSVQALRDHGIADADTRIVAAHLSHHNPPNLAERLRATGAELLSDGDSIQL